MKVIIAGSRHIYNLGWVAEAVKDSGFIITELVTGDEPNGVDRCGLDWAKKQFPCIKITHFPADWKNIEVKPCLVRFNAKGAYNALAGIIRNEQMAEYAEALILIWDGTSPGSKDMLSRAKKHGLKIYQLVVQNNG